MKIHFYICCAACALLLSARAEEKGVVSQNRANVRGQPSFTGEVVTQLKKGDDIVILEEITLTKHAPGETAKWLKIKMPENTPVWVFAAFIDTNNAVAKPKLNLRAGPGENYSVVGRLEKGDAVKPIRTVEDWMEIETPDKAYAFLAADLVAKEGAATVAKEEPKPVEAPKEVVKTEPPPAIKQEPVKQEPPPVIATPVVTLPTESKVAATKDPEPEKPKPAQRLAQVQEQKKPEPAPVAEPPKETAKPAEKLPEVAPAPAPPKENAIPRRIVRREGIVRTTTSIQAPTYFELVSAETRKTINYIHTEKSGINIKQFRGKKIIITGEEMIDPRWPNVPVIEVETLDYNP